MRKDYKAYLWKCDVENFQRTKKMLELAHKMKNDFFIDRFKKRLEELQAKWPNHKLGDN